MSVEKPWGWCDPNSEHQLWSKWVFVVHAYPPRVGALPNDETVKENCVRFFTKLCKGRSAQLSITRPELESAAFVRWVFTLRVDDKRALDTMYQRWVLEQITHFMKNGFGADTYVYLKPVVIEAGDTEDGKPTSQLLVLPRIPVTSKVFAP